MAAAEPEAAVSRKYIIIRNQHSGLVLDGTNTKVRIQRLSIQDGQQWELEGVGSGKVMIINKGNGKAMDVECGAVVGHNVITYEKCGSPTQQWYVNSDGTIVNAVSDLALNIYMDDYNPGNRVIVRERHGGSNQKFEIQYPPDLP